MKRVGYISDKAVKAQESATSVVISGSRSLETIDQTLARKYPKISKWVMDYIEMQSPSMRKVLLQKGISNALLSTMETVQSAYVAPSVSGIGPAKQMLTEWWFNPIWGQPRMTDIKTLKTLSRGHIGSMCVEAILDQVMQVEWNVVPKYRHQLERPVGMKTEEKAQEINLEAFLDDPNRNHDNWDKLLRMHIRNILETDDGLFVKVFEEYMRPPVPNVQIASTGDVRSYTAQPAWDQVPKPGSPLIEVYAEDGSSFLKQTDMHGYLMNYWQYSFVTPRRPVRFETSEILYVMQNPRAGSPYGYSPFDSLVDTLTMVGKAMQFNEHFYENSAIPALQFDYPWIKNVEELEAMGKYIEDNFMGPEKSFRTVATQGGVKVNPISVNPKDLQNLELQDFYIKLVLAKLKVPPVILGLDGLGGGNTGGGGTGSAVAQTAVHKSRAIKPLMTLVEHAINRNLVPDILGVAPSDSLVEFRWGDMIDIEERERMARIDQVYLGTGVMVPNEVRQRDQMDRVPWGDGPFIPGAKLFGDISAKPVPEEGGTSPGGIMEVGNAQAPHTAQQEPAAMNVDRPQGISESQDVQAIAHTGGRGPTEIAGGVIKSIANPKAEVMRKGLQELTKEARDRLVDGESYESIERDVLPRVKALVQGIIKPKSARSMALANESIEDFKDVLARLAVAHRAGEL